MDLGSLLLIIALALLVIWFVARPFFETQQVWTGTAGTDEHERSSLLAERERILAALQELDFDHTLGKVPEEDYPAQRAALLQRGADVLRRMDALAIGVPADAAQYAAPFAPAAQEDPLEAAITARRAIEQVSGDPIEGMIAARRSEHQGQTAGFCPRCGKPVQKADRFCPKCGAGLG
ncbi:MAG: zinc-ribbon domain-containing protein [Chloroflexota bacterium]